MKYMTKRTTRNLSKFIETRTCIWIWTDMLNQLNQSIEGALTLCYLKTHKNIHNKVTILTSLNKNNADNSNQLLFQLWRCRFPCSRRKCITWLGWLPAVHGQWLQITADEAAMFSASRILFSCNVHSSVRTVSTAFRPKGRLITFE